MSSTRDYERARSALPFISPDDRDVWVRVGMALRSGFGDDGFDLWDAWSRKSDRYVERDARDVWQSIKRDGGVTLATLFREARMNGWRDDGATPEELEAERRGSAAKERAERARRRAEAAKKARAVWEAASTQTDNHQYLAQKRVQAHGLRLYRGSMVISDMPCDGSLIVPAGDGKGAIHTLEFIHPEPRDGDNKRFLPGGNLRAGYFSIGTMNGAGPLCVCEGYATAASVHEATGRAAVVAFNAGNLVPVARALRKRFPELDLLVCADDDISTSGNPGLTKAKEAVDAVGGTVAVPDFGEDRPLGMKDFNDMAAVRGLEAVAECIRRVESGEETVSGNGAAWNAPRITAAEVLETFRKWLYLPDPGVVYVPLGAVAANLMEGDPVWVMIVGPSSGGKTEVIFAIARLPYVRLGATLTEAALLSGTPKKQMAAGSKGGLLREIGKFGILALKDFTSVLSMHRDKRAELLAALREIFDGSWPRHVGTDGGRTLEWSGKLGLVAACTAAIDTHHAVMATMGERFLLYRLPHIDPAKQAARALDNAGREGVMRKELAAAIEGLFAGLDIRGKGLPPIDKDEKARLVALSSLIASARSAVERNPYGAREIDLIPDTEAPARLAQTLCRLYAGMLAIGLDRTTAWPLVVKTGLDCVPKLRRAVFEVLLTAEDWLTTKTVATRIQHPTMTARRSLEDLNAHGVADRRPAEKGKGDGKSDMCGCPT